MLKSIKKKIVVTVLSFSLFLIILTIISILVVNSKKEEKDFSSFQYYGKKDNIKPSDKYDTFNENDLKITIYDENKIKNPLNGEEDISIRYFQIDGLKDKNIQEKINNSIYNTALEISNKTSHESYCYITANFSNILSYYCGSYDTPNENNEYVVISVETGEKISFSELLISGKNVIDSIREGVFISFSDTFAVDPENNDAYKFDENVDELVVKIINDYKIGKFDFYIQENAIKLEFGERKGAYNEFFGGFEIEVSVNVNFYENLDVIAVYNRFGGDKDLYDGKYQGRSQNPVGAKINDYFIYDFGYKKENLFVKIGSGYGIDSSYERCTIDSVAKEKKCEKDLFNDNLKKLYNGFIQNEKIGKNKINYLLVAFDVLPIDLYDNLREVKYVKMSLEFSKEDFENNIYKKIIDDYVEITESFPYSLDVFGKYDEYLINRLKRKPENKTIYVDGNFKEYDFNTLTSKDVFKDGFDYMKLIKEYMQENWGNYYSSNNLNIKFILKTGEDYYEDGSIDVIVSHEGEKDIIIPLTKFGSENTVFML